MSDKICKSPIFARHLHRRGFTIFLMFMVLLLVLFAELFSQSLEINSVGKLQSRILNTYGEIRPQVDSRVKLLLRERLR